MLGWQVVEPTGLYTAVLLHENWRGHAHPFAVQCSFARGYGGGGTGDGCDGKVGVGDDGADVEVGASPDTYLRDSLCFLLRLTPTQT